MNKSTIIAIIVILVVICGGAWFFWANKVPSADYKNATYIIEGQSVTLVNGKSEVAAAPGSAEKVVTQYFGNDATGDLNGDGVPDIAFILSQNSGGSGTFYYAVATLKTASGYQGTNAVLLGDRIAPQTTEIKDGQVIVNYADRNPGEPMTTQPSLGVTKYLIVQGATLSEAPKSFLYSCDGGKTITALYSEGTAKPATQAGGPPIPGGSAALTLSDGRTMTLAQTISADGVRYANADESFVFWNKGNGALVLENNQEKSFIGCIMVAPVSAGELSKIYSNGSDGFSIRLPADYPVDEKYKYQEFGPSKTISGIKFTIAPSVATGTNLASDTYLSVEEIPKTKNCTASLFLDNVKNTSMITDGSTTYSVASSTGAGAGNRYEETVYAMPGTNPCIALRYFIHYGVFENYPAGAVREFDHQALIEQFDAIRRTLILAP